MAWATGLARRQGSQLVCVYVAAHPTWAWLALGMAVEVPQDSLYGEMEAEAKEVVQEIMTDVGEFDVPVRCVARCGDPVTEIIRVADQLQVDAVVVGASTGALSWLTGSVPTRLVRNSRWPVTVVP
jgi:nucleotide-binding universal stress UspA family protein